MAEEPADYCKFEGEIVPKGESRCNPETGRMMTCLGNDQWQQEKEECPPTDESTGGSKSKS